MTREPLRLVAPYVKNRGLRRRVERSAKQQSPGIDACFRNPGGLRSRLGRVLLRPDLPDRILETVTRLPSPSHVRRPVGVRQPAARVPLALLGDRPRRPGKGATTRAAAFPAAGTEPARTGWVVGLQTQVLRRHRNNCVTGAVDVSHARTPVDLQQQPGHVAPLGRMRPKRARRATQLLPAHHAPSPNGPLFVRDRSQVCAGLSPARGAFPHPFAVSYRVEAAGIEPASADAPDRASTSLGSRCVSPGGRLGADQPTG